MDKLTISGKKIGNRLQIINRSALDHWVSQLVEGEEVELTLVKDKNLKTIRQLRLLYSCFRTISEHTGYELEEVKIMMKMRAGLCHIHNIEGSDITVCSSISDLTKKEIKDFIDFIHNWASRTLNLPLLTNEDKTFLNTI